MPNLKFWNIVAEEDGDSATLTLSGEIVSRRPVDLWTGEPDAAQYICPEDFAADLEKIKNKGQVTIRINSVGGEVYTAIAIHNALKALAGIKTVIVDGIAASAASVIAMAGDRIKVYAGSIMMIHNVSTAVAEWVTIADLKKIIRNLDAHERATAAIYDEKTHLGVDTIRTLMDRETWMTGAEAVAKGFADELITDGKDPDISFSAANRLLMVNGVRHSTEGLHVPELPCIKPMASAGTAPAAASQQPENPSKEGEKTMEKFSTIEELRAACPELVAQIEKEAGAKAVSEDRARIQEIEEIADTIGDAELVNAAKFTKPTNASTLALEAMKRAKAAGLDFMNKRAGEMKAAEGVKATASMPEDTAAIKAQNQADEAAAIAKAAELYKQTFSK